MIMRTTALDWLSSTIAHEWTHLYLGQRPLGIHYESSPELRTMNETTASISGNEIGGIVMLSATTPSGRKQTGVPGSWSPV